MGERPHAGTISGMKAVHMSSIKIFFPSTIMALLGICLAVVWERLKLKLYQNFPVGLPT